MKKLTLIVTVLISINVYSQNTKPVNSTNSTTIQELKQVLNLQFSNIVTGNSFSNFGNYAALKTDDKSLALTASFVQKNGSIFTLAASGGATEGVSAFFNEGDVNSNVGLSATYNWLINPFKSTSISRNAFSAKKIKDEISAINLKFEEEEIAIAHKKDLIFEKTNLTKLKKTKTDIDKALVKINAELLTINDTALKEIAKTKQDSLKFEQDKVALNITHSLNKIKLYNDPNYFDELFEIKSQEKDAKIIKKEKELLAIGIENINITWFSFGYGVKKDAFKLFDEILDFDKQIMKESYVSHQASVAFSGYKWSSFENNSRFWSLGLEFSYTSNYKSLDNLEVVDANLVSEDPSRELINKQSVYVGNYIDDIKKLTLFYDYYRFLGAKEVVALHINPKSTFGDHIKPVMSLQTGLLIPFKKTDKQESFVNIEVFYKVNDVFNTSDSKKSLLGRNTIGLQATFPISFLTTKK